MNSHKNALLTPKVESRWCGRSLTTGDAWRRSPKTLPNGWRDSVWKG